MNQSTEISKHLMADAVNAVIALQNTKGALAKKAVLQAHKDNEFFRLLLYYALNPLLSYRLSEQTLRNTDLIPSDPRACTFDTIFDCCSHLSVLRGMDDATTRQVLVFLYHHTSGDERDLYIKLLAKTLRLGVTAKTVNQAIPDLIPVWEVQQAYPIEKHPLPTGKVFYVTQKLNGIRATYYQGQMIARSGAVIDGLDHITDFIQTHIPADYVLDGELTLADTTGYSDNEAFRIATGIINGDSVNKTGICFTVFDAIPVDDFNRAEPQVRYLVRRSILDAGIATHCGSDTPVRVLPLLYAGRDKAMIDTLLEQMVREDKEGLMVNLDVPYRRTRHNGILKVKRFYTMDLPIVACEEGSGRLAGTLGAFVLRYGENEVRVGSGFTDEQRTVFWNRREDMIGTLCEVKYKEVSQDKNTGLQSLQFPVFVALREDKTEVSYG